MTAPEAARILEISPDAKPEQIEARFLDLRAKLEDRLAKAPTPGLKDKYRRSLEEATKACEVLMLGTDGSSLPVVQRVAKLKAETEALSAAPPPMDRGGPARRRTSGSREFALVAVIAVLMLAAGGWWVVKVRSEGAEEARLAAEAEAQAQAEAERVVAAEQEEKERLGQLAAHIRVQLAEARLIWEVIEREERDAERALSDLRSELRSLRDPAPGRLNEMNARMSAQQEYVRWLRDIVLNHPARRLRLRTEEFLSAGQIEMAAEELSQLKEAIDPLRTEMAAARERLLTIEGTVRITSSPEGIPWEFTDGFGRRRTGRTPGMVRGVAAGNLAVLFKRSDWPEQRRSVSVPRGGEATAQAEYAEGTVLVASQPEGLEWEFTDRLGRRHSGRTPGTATGIPVGEVTVAFKRPGWRDRQQVVSIPRGGEATARTEYREGEVAIESNVKEVEWQLTDAAGRRRSGRGPATLTGVATGEAELIFRHPPWPDQRLSLAVDRERTATARADFAGGRLRIESTPAGAEVWEGKRRLGTAPLELEDLTPGRRELTLKLEGHRTARIAPEVQPDETVRVAVELQAGPEPGQAWMVPGIDLVMQPIPYGTFDMGSNAGTVYDRPVTRVTLSETFWLGRTEVTQAQWEAVMEETPSRFKGPDRPVERVSWTEAMDFCRRLTERERAAGRLPPEYRYTLPTEAQWELACRAGTTGENAGRLEAMVWYRENSKDQTQPVGAKQPNAWGLFDMNGNVWEWCADWYAKLPGGAVLDPTGPPAGSKRMLRGGGWRDRPVNVRSASRGMLSPEARYEYLGFRLALVAAR